MTKFVRSLQVLLAALAVSLLSALPAAAVAATHAESDCLFGWAESNYAAYFAPRGSPSQSYGPYYLRYYSQTSTYLGVSSETSRLYYLGPLSGNTILDLGDASTWYATAGCGASDLQKAKDMFGELRTTMNSFANDGKTGFLDTRAQAMRTDLEANVTPQGSMVADILVALNRATNMYEDARAYSASNTQGLYVSGSRLIRPGGNPYDVWYGYGSYEQCQTDSATGVTSTVTCVRAGSGSADRIGNRINAVGVALTAGTAANQYSYTVRRYYMPVTYTASGSPIIGTMSLAKNALLSTSTSPVYLPVGSGHCQDGH